MYVIFDTFEMIINAVGVVHIWAGIMKNIQPQDRCSVKMGTMMVAKALDQDLRAWVRSTMCLAFHFCPIVSAFI